MKKLGLILMAVMVAVFSFTLVGCGGDDNTLKVNEVTHSIFYAPLYVAINNGYFEDEGIKVELTNGGGADKSMAALLSGDADIAFCGPEAAIYSQEAKNRPVVFGQLTKRDGSFLISKTNEGENFDWSNLAGKTVIGGRAGGVPAMTLQYVIEQQGLEIGTEAEKAQGKVYLRTDVEFNLTASTFSSTDADYCTLFEPNASDLVAAGKGYNVASVGEKSGEVPYTAFITRKSNLEKKADKLEKFLRAVRKGYKFCLTATTEQIATAIAPSFTGVDSSILANAVKAYARIDAWVESPAMKESAFNKLQDIIDNAGKLTKRMNFADVVDNTIANKVMQDIG